MHRMRRGLLVLPIVLAAMASVAWSQDQPAAKAKEPLAVVGGQAIYDEELQPLIQGQLLQIRNEEYEAKRQGLENLINRKLVEAEAVKKGVAPQQLLDQEVNSKVPEPADSDIEAFYEGQKEQIKRPLADVRSQIRQLLKEQRLEQARQNYVQQLRAKVDISIQLMPPKVAVGYDPARVRGDAKAPVTIVEFADFQCPFCQKSYLTVQELLTKYKGRIKLAFRDFPLRSIHSQAQIASEAGRCAQDQGKFWEFHDALFTNPGKLDKAGLTEHARQLKLDEKAFSACLDSGKFRDQIEEDVEAGTNIGISGTPAFFINGILVSGAQPASVFEERIESELAALARQRAPQ